MQNFKNNWILKDFNHHHTYKYSRTFINLNFCKFSENKPKELLQIEFFIELRLYAKKYIPSDHLPSE